MKIKTINYHFTILTLLSLACGSISSVFAEDPPASDSQTSAQPPQIAKQERTEPDQQTSLLADLSKELMSSETEILNLKAGEDSFDAYYHNRSGAELHGGIIFFPDDFTHPNWPIFIQPLRTGLTDFGWSTLAIPLPAPITLAQPIRTLPSLKAIKAKPSNEETDTPVEPTEESATITPSQPVSKEPEIQAEQTSNTYKQIIQRGITAVQALQQKGISQFVLAGVGTGATWATAIAINLQEQTDISLLIINATQSQDLSAPALLALIPDLKLTTLDIYTSNPGHTSRANNYNSRLRIEKARRNNLNNYHQSRLPASSSTPQGQEWLIRYTRGLLETYIVKAEKEKISIPSTPPPAINQPPGTPVPALNKQPTPI